MPRLLPCALPPWMMWFVAGLLVAAAVSVLVARSVVIRAPARKSKACVEDLLPTMRSGDVVLVADVGLIGRAQRFILGTPISHVGVLVVDGEGTTSAVPRVLEAEREHGVTLTPLWRWLQNRDNRIFYRPLRAPPKTDERRRVAVDAFVSRNLGRPYSYRFWMEATRVFPFALPMPFDADSKDEARFCSELVAEALVAAGALDGSQPCHLVMPRDLLDERVVKTDRDGEEGSDTDDEEKHDSKLHWRTGWGLGATQSLVTRLSAYEVKRRAEFANV